IFVSFKQKKQHLDLTGDPWNGRTLEWSTASPPPHYNFAIIPQVRSQDAFWKMKKETSDKRLVTSNDYEDIHMPKNTPMGIYISIFAFLFGFAMIWHIFWLA